VGQPGVLGAADPVLDAGVGAVPGLEVGELADFGVGGEGLEPPAAGVGERELRPGMGSFPANDDPHAGRPGRPTRPATATRRATPPPTRRQRTL